MLTNRIANALSWGVIGLGVNKVVTFAAKLIVARFIAPDEFGAFAIALVYISILTIFAQFGIKTTFIRLPHDTMFGRKLSSGFLFLVANSFFLVLLTVLLLPILIPKSDNSADLQIILLWLLVAIPISSFGLVPIALLERRLRFKTLIKVEFISNIVSAFVAILMVIYGFGVFSLVAQHVLMLLIKSILAWNLQSWRPRYSFSILEVRKLLKLSAPVAANSLITAIRSNADKVIILIFLGLSAAGLYALAMLITNTLRNQAALVVDRVMLPSYSKISNDVDHLSRFYLRVVAYYSVIFIPISALVSVFAEQLMFLFGPQWSDAAPVLQILAIGAAIHASGGSPATVLTAMGHPKKVTRIAFNNLVFVFLPLVLCAAYFGDLLWVSIAVVLQIATLRIAYFMEIKSLIGLNVRQVFHAQLPGLLLALPIVTPLVLGVRISVLSVALLVFTIIFIIFLLFATRLGHYLLLKNK